MRQGTPHNNFLGQVPFVNDVYEINHIWTPLMKSNEEWSSQLALLVRASHRYREVTRSIPVEVLIVFQASLRNWINCVHNCEDHSSIWSSPFCQVLLIWGFEVNKVIPCFATTNKRPPGGPPIGSFNPITPTKFRPQSRNPDGFYQLIPIPVRFFGVSYLKES